MIEFARIGKLYEGCEDCLPLKIGRPSWQECRLPKIYETVKMSFPRTSLLRMIKGYYEWLSAVSCQLSA